MHDSQVVHGSTFIFLQVNIPFSYQHLLKMLSYLQCIPFAFNDCSYECPCLSLVFCFIGLHVYFCANIILFYDYIS